MLVGQKTGQLFLLLSILITVICLFLYYSLRDITEIKKELKKLNEKKLCECAPPTQQKQKKKTEAIEKEEIETLVKELDDEETISSIKMDEE